MLNKSIKPNYKSKKNTTLFIVIIILTAIGVGLRIYQYLLNPNLWLDELFLAKNILEGSFDFLSGKLSQGQAAPILFIFLIKLITLLFGIGEHSLRFIPFISSVLTLVLFPIVFKRLGLLINSIALSFLSFNYYHIYYTVELKQYSTDTLMTLLFLCLFQSFNKQAKINSVFFIKLLIIPILFLASHISPMLFFGFIPLLFGKRQTEFKFKQTLIIFTGVVSGLLLYKVQLQSLSNDPYLNDYWKNYFYTFESFRHSGGLRVLIQFFSNLNHSLISIYPTILTIPIIIIGIYQLSLLRNKTYTLTVIGPIIVTFLASFFGYYPFHGRLILFLLPLFLILLSTGIYKLLVLPPRYSFFSWPIIFTLVTSAVGNNFHDKFSGIPKEEFTPLLSYIEKNQQKGDTIYVYHRCINALHYYQKNTNWSHNQTGLNLTIVEGTQHPIENQNYHKEISPLKKYNRIWLVVTNPYSTNEEKVILKEFRAIGSEILSLRAVQSYTKLFITSKGKASSD